MAHEVQSKLIHATAVAWQGRAVLITGASGTGKSALGLQIMAFGGDLVADDQTILTLRDGAVWASCPPQIAGLIEARFVGIIAAKAVPSARLALAINMDVTESDRMPPERHFDLFGCKVPLLHKVDKPYFPAAILQYLTAGQRLP